MATVQSTIDLIFNGIDRTGAATMAALDNAKKFSGALQNATEPIANFTASAVKLEAGLLAGGLAMTVFAVKTAGDFEQAFAQISTLFDASAEDLAGFKENVKAYAATSGKSMEDLMASLGAAIGSGVKWTDSLELMTVAERLAIATKSDMKGATEVLVGTMNAYGMSTKDAGALADLMFQIIKDGKIEMTDLSASLANITPISAAAGIGMKEVGAAIAVLTAAGMQPSTAIDALKSAITNIIKPSAQATALAAELGIEFNAAALKAKGLEGVFVDVAKATGGSADKMALLFGDVTGLAAVMTLTGPQAAKFSETIGSMGNSAGSVAEAYKKMAEEIGVSTQRVSNAFTALLITIGTPLLDEFGGIAAAIAKIFTALADSAKTGGLKDLVSYIESIFGDLQKSIETVAKNLPAALAKADFSGFKIGIEAIINAFKTLFGSIDITSVDGLTKAIELAGFAFLGLSKFVGGVIEGFKPLFDKLVDIGSKTKDFDQSLFGLGGTIGSFALQITALLPGFNALLGILTFRAGLGLITDLRTMALLMPGVVALLAGPAGFAVALTALAYEVYKTQTAIMALIDAKNKLKESEAQSIAVQERATTTLARFGETSGIVVKSIDEADKLIKDGTVTWSTAANGWVKAGDALADVADASNKAQEDFRKSEITLQNTAAATDKAADSTGKLANAQKDVSKYALQTVPIFDELTGKITGYEEKLVKSATGTIALGKASDTASSNLEKIAKQTEKAEEATRKWNQEIAKMAFEEKLKLIDSQTKITTANIEADAKRGVAAFESLNAGIGSTGELLGKLFTGLDFSKIGWAEQRLIEGQIDKENQRRDQDFALQKKLIEAQIRQMQAQTDMLNKGEGMIKIDGAGLKPHLEAFMWEILQTIQVKVNKDGLKMLLGV